MSISLTSALLDQIRISDSCEIKLESLENHLMKRITKDQLTRDRCIGIIVNFCYLNPEDDIFYDPHQGANYISGVWYDAMAESRDEYLDFQNTRSSKNYKPTLEDYFTKVTIKN